MSMEPDRKAQPARNLTRIPRQELQDAILKAVGEQGGRMEGYEASDVVARVLGGSQDDAGSLGAPPPDHRSWHGMRTPCQACATAAGVGLAEAQKRWSGQVRRAMDRLAGEGLLVKVGKGQRTPDGSYASNTVYYYSPGAYAAEEERTARALVKAEATRRRWEKIRWRLQEGPGVRLDSEGRLFADSWELLLDKGGW